MALPLPVVKRKGKKKFNGIVTSIKTCAPWATICAWKGVGFCIHYVMKIAQQATNGHHNYILSIFNTKIDLGYWKLETCYFLHLSTLFGHSMIFNTWDYKRTHANGRQEKWCRLCKLWCAKILMSHIVQVSRYSLSTSMPRPCQVSVSKV